MNLKNRPFCRMQEGGAFGGILERAVRSLPGCIAAAFVDYEGEAVDAVGWADEFDIKVTGAHMLIILAEAGALRCGPCKDLIITATRLSYRIVVLPEGYALIMMFARDMAFHVSARVLGVCVGALSREAGFALDPAAPRWFSVEVATSPKGNRPRKARGQGDWHDVEVLGAIVGLANRERGYRVRLPSGHEVTLLREPLGRWWSDASLDDWGGEKS